ncbi:MAG: hypothetical protein COA57_14340 [Flavobacteriales bacterium]|nr:MAG: hypothetical protein COA57_14340 [Flavobacteriales bacterium]
MKKTIALFLLAFIHLSFFAQRSIDKNTDELTRASLASQYLQEAKTELYATSFGEACANIILSVYRELQPIPDISIDRVSGQDKEKLRQLIGKLQGLRKTPPTWAELAKMEEERLIKWDKAVRRQSKYTVK